MSQFLISALAWLLVYSGVSVPEIPVMGEIGFNQPVACQFGFLSDVKQPCDVPAVNRREQLRGVLFVFELPAATTGISKKNSAAESVPSTDAFFRILPAVAFVADSARNLLLSIGDSVQATAFRIGELTFESVVKLVHPPIVSMAAVTESRLQDAVSSFGKFDLSRIVDRVYSVARRLSQYTGDSHDPYWSYYQDCDRWGIVWKWQEVSSCSAVATLDAGEIFPAVSKQIQLTLRILVPGSLELDWIQCNRETLNSVSRLAMDWWKMVVSKD